MSDPLDPLDVCNVLSQWANVAGVTSTAGTGGLAIYKSDLLSRLIYGRERGPSQTPCPVHKGKWMGCHFGWPGSVWISVDPVTHEQVSRPAEVDTRLQAEVDAGCRCWSHKGSSCTTGWNPDEHCCAEVSA